MGWGTRTDLEVAPPADHVGVARVLVRPAEHGALAGHGVQRPPHAPGVLAAPADDVDHAGRLVPAERKGREARGERAGWGGVRCGAGGGNDIAINLTHSGVDVCTAVWTACIDRPPCLLVSEIRGERRGPLELN